MKSALILIFFSISVTALRSENGEIQTTTVENFENINDWGLNYKRNFSGSAYISRNELPASASSGNYIQIRFSGVKGSGFRLARKEAILLPGCIFSITVSIFGFGDIFEFYADIRDVRNKFHRISSGILKHSGWKTITIPIAGIRSRRIQLNGGRDGIMLEGFFIKTLTGSGIVRLLLDDITVSSASCVLEHAEKP